MDDKLATVHRNLGWAYARTRDDIPGAIDSYEKAIELRPDLAKSANNLAWLLATLEDDSLRNGQRALQLAQRIASVRQEDPSSLDTLAAAYAETGDFSKAVDVASRAMALSKQLGNEKLAAKIQSRIEKYREKQPHRASL